MTRRGLVVTVGGRRFRGRAIDLRRASVGVPAETVAAALERALETDGEGDADGARDEPGGEGRDDEDDGPGDEDDGPGDEDDGPGDEDDGPGDESTDCERDDAARACDGTAVADDGRRVSVRCARPPSPPRPLLVTPTTALDLHGWLATAARSRGERPPQASALVATRHALADCERPTVDTGTARRRLAEAGGDVAALRERVATLRGRLQTLRDLGRDDEAAAVRDDLAETAAALSEAETERTAARQRLDRLEAEAREARDARERRLRLEDRVANLERAARAALVARVYEEFARTVARLPGDADPGEGPDEFEGDAVTAALGAVAVADPSIPVVCTAGSFGSAGEAATRLDAPVVRVRPRV